jgi:peptidoglycan/xylan/chitin deacetylase (PgdA/CDA1 family)
MGEGGAAGAALPTGLFVSVDVDSLDLYLGLYGRDREGDNSNFVRATYELGVRRFLELFDALGLTATFFVVGKNLYVPAAADLAREAFSKGHVLGNHTYMHSYDLIRMPELLALGEIAGGHKAVQELTGQEPFIFRAPGYNMTDREYGLLRDYHYRYDSSPLPSYPYLALKYSVMLGLKTVGRKSRSIWGNPRMFLGPRGPYVKDGITVLPCATTRFLRLPVIGTAITSLPKPLVGHLLRSLRGAGFVGLEFHAVDLMDLELDKLPAELASQKDLRIPLAVKRERIRTFLSALLETHAPCVL